MLSSKNDFLGISIGLGVLIASSYISFDIPLNTVNIPISLQSLAVLLVAYFLGQKNGTLVILLYLVLGALGLPVFADGNSGIEVLKGNSGGYLFGFLFVTIILESFFKALKSDFLRICIYMAIGTAIILLSGGLRLLQFYDMDIVWSSGIQPFLAGGLVKVILGAAIAYYFRERRFKG